MNIRREPKTGDPDTQDNQCCSFLKGFEIPIANKNLLYYVAQNSVNVEGIEIQMLHGRSQSSAETEKKYHTQPHDSLIGCCRFSYTFLHSSQHRPLSDKRDTK